MGGKLEEQEISDLIDAFQEPQGPSEERLAIEAQVARGVGRQDDVPAAITIISAFDDLLGCFAVGGQLKHYYRYGTYDRCDLQRKKFWFSIRNGAFTECKKPVAEMSDRELAQHAHVQAFYQAWATEKSTKGTSEDVWDVRDEPLQNPFLSSSREG